MGVVALSGFPTYFKLSKWNLPHNYIHSLPNNLIYQPLIAAPSINKKIELLQTLSIHQQGTDKVDFLLIDWWVYDLNVCEIELGIYFTHWGHTLIYRLAKNHDIIFSSNYKWPVLARDSHSFSSLKFYTKKILNLN